MKTKKKSQRKTGKQTREDKEKNTDKISETEIF